MPRTIHSCLPLRNRQPCLAALQACWRRLHGGSIPSPAAYAWAARPGLRAGGESPRSSLLASVAALPARPDEQILHLRISAFLSTRGVSCHGAFCCNIKISTLNFAMLESQVNNAKNNPDMPAACKIHSYAWQCSGAGYLVGRHPRAMRTKAGTFLQRFPGDSPSHRRHSRRHAFARRSVDQPATALASAPEQRLGGTGVGAWQACWRRLHGGSVPSSAAYALTARPGLRARGNLLASAAARLAWVAAAAAAAAAAAIARGRRCAGAGPGRRCRCRKSAVFGGTRQCNARPSWSARSPPGLLLRGSESAEVGEKKGA
jgi:hypothetical protein